MAARLFCKETVGGSTPLGCSMIDYLFIVFVILGVAFAWVWGLTKNDSDFSAHTIDTKKVRCPGCLLPLEPDTLFGKVVVCLDDRVYCKACLRGGTCGCGNAA